MKRALCICLGVAALAVACPFDVTLREYLDARFWLPFAKQPFHFERPNVRRVDAPFAGMITDRADTPLGKLRSAYREMSEPTAPPIDPAKLAAALDTARADASLSPREREEIELLDAKIDLRLGGAEDQEPIRRARAKLEEFVRSAQTPEFRSEARGWLARAYYLLGDQTAAGKIYLDELNRNGSNLGRESILNSLKITYGWDGGTELREHLADYFDTPEHALFAIELTTNPRWDRYDRVAEQERADADAARQYARIRNLLNQHASLFTRGDSADPLTLLSMRTALRMGDPAEAVRLGKLPAATSNVRLSPDFLWMLASAEFLTADYAAAAAPLRQLYTSRRASQEQRHAAAYGLCGVSRKLGDRVEQIRWALALHSLPITETPEDDYGSDTGTGPIYWGSSGWDLDLVLDAEASIDDLRAFLDAYPNVPNNRLVRYSLAVRLARDNRYPDAADVYDSIHANRRAGRMRQLAALYAEAQRSDLSPAESQEARYRLAQFIGSNEDRLYFNDALWAGYQRYALTAKDDSRLTREERDEAVRQERDMQDQQEERWRAWLILHDIVRDAGPSPLGRKAAQLALDDLTRISERFGRTAEVRAAVRDMRQFLRH